MKKYKYLIFIFIVIILIIITTIFIINSKQKNSKPSNSIKTNTISIKNSPEPEPTESEVEEIIEEPEEEIIYGYDENAMQVEEFYNGYPTCAYIEIPKTNVSLPVLSNQTVKGMEFSCCKLYSTGDINKSGNTYIVAHNYENGTLFSDNKNLKIGDKIILTGLYKNRLEYTIYNIFNTDPTDTSYLTKKVDDNFIEITLQTCNNDENDTRLIIEARHEIIK